MPRKMPTHTPITIKQGDLPKLRRIALGAQGLLRDAPFGRGISGARKAISHIGYVQIDTISVVERAHHHVLRARVPNFQPQMLNKMLRDRSIFEYWSHAAAFLPMQDYRYSICHREELLERGKKWMKPSDDKTVKEVLRRVEAEGPLRSRDLEDPRETRSGWWDWKPAKKALEQLFFEGVLMVTEREGFQKSYDLAERVLPEDLDTSRPSFEEYGEHLLDQQINCHGLVTRKGVTYMRRNKKLKEAVKNLIDLRIADGQLVEVQTPDGQLYLTQPSAFDANAPRTNPIAKILSPFDNIVIQRERLSSLFGFDYLIECYVPEPKRQYGYFTLPIIYQSDFVGRMDCKAHRKDSLLEIKSLHLEMAKQLPKLAPALAAALPSFLAFQGCDKLALTYSTSKTFAAALKNESLNQGIQWTTKIPNT